MQLSSYGKVWAFGTPALTNLFNGHITVQEKYDGSQFSVMKSDGCLQCRSKNNQLDLDAPDKMFAPVVEYCKSIVDKLPEGVIFRCEFLRKTKHNVLVYDRVPKNNLVLFDVFDPAVGGYAVQEDVLKSWAEQLGIEPVAELWRGKGEDFSQSMFANLLKTTSSLGGPPIEGVVIKNYGQFDRLDGTLLKGKYVSEQFKEVHKSTWTKEHPDKKDIIQQIAAGYKPHAWWLKAIQHLRDDGKLTDSPKDIGPLLAELGRDMNEELHDDIQKQLWSWAWPQIQRILMRGFPDFYKKLLVDKQFEATPKEE